MMPTAWAISDGAAGNRRQAEALAAACAAQVETLELQPRAPWRWLAPRRLPGIAQAFGAGFAARLTGPRPALVIGCGRQAALATRLLRSAACRAVQILDPRIDCRHWDLVVAPAHDRLRGSNVLTTLGSLNPVDEAWLAAGRADWPQFGLLPAPRTVLLLGAPTAAARYGAEDIGTLATTLRSLQAEAGGSLSVLVSPRSPDWLRKQATVVFGNGPGIRWCGEQDGPNPYRGLLGWAGRIVVTVDSANLMSEACAVGVPVLAAMQAAPGSRIADLQQALQDGGWLRPLAAGFGSAPPPLRECAAVAEELQRRLQSR